MIKLHFEKLSKFERISEPCTVAIPFKQGNVYDLSDIMITDGNEAVPYQLNVTSRWPENSVKWLLVNFLADLPGNRAKDYYCVVKDKNSAPAYLNNTDSVLKQVFKGKSSVEDIFFKQKNALFPYKAEVKSTGSRLCIDTGAIKIELSMPKEKGIFNRIIKNNTVYEKDNFFGPVIYDEKDIAGETVICDKGWEIVEDGPIRAVVKTRGKHVNCSGTEWIDFCLRIYAYAGKPWIRIDYQIINSEEDECKIKGIEFHFKSNSVEAEDIDTALAVSNYLSKIIRGRNGEKLYYLIDSDKLLYEANEHIPETFYGTFWADWNHKNKGGVCATIYQAQQNYPKAFEADKTGIKIKIFPKECGCLNLMQGMAKTHKMFLHFHEENETIEKLNVRSLQFQMPDRPVLDPEVYEHADVFEDVFVENKINYIERKLIQKADLRARAYGILNFGDAPDFGYTYQGRGNGELVWLNNEYDFPHAAMLLYARTSERRMLDYMLTSAEHWMDVDICHYSKDPYRDKGQIIHSANHASGKVEISHEWVEGLLDYYHQTGEYSAYECAIGIGKNVLRHLELPKYQQKGGISARETGWALRTLVALYKETNDETWLKPAEVIIKHFEDWKEEFGGWLSPYTDHTVIRVPFMIAIAVGSLMRYYKVRPDEKIKEMIIDAVKDLIENCKLDNGLFYYKELPSLRRLGNNVLVLEALVYAYELTEDVNFLKEGLDTFYCEVMNGSSHINRIKHVIKDALIIEGLSPKEFAQSFYPIVLYYRAALKEGIINTNQILKGDSKNEWGL